MWISTCGTASQGFDLGECQAVFHTERCMSPPRVPAAPRPRRHSTPSLFLTVAKSAVISVHVTLMTNSQEALNVSTGCLDSLFLKSPWKPILLWGFLQFRHSFVGVLTVSVSLFSDIRPNYLLHLSNGWSLHSADAELR